MYDCTYGVILAWIFLMLQLTTPPGDPSERGGQARPGPGHCPSTDRQVRPTKQNIDKESTRVLDFPEEDGKDCMLQSCKVFNHFINNGVFARSGKCRQAFNEFDSSAGFLKRMGDLGDWFFKSTEIFHF